MSKVTRLITPMRYDLGDVIMTMTPCKVTRKGFGTPLFLHLPPKPVPKLRLIK